MSWLLVALIVACVLLWRHRSGEIVGAWLWGKLLDRLMRVNDQKALIGQLRRDRGDPPPRSGRYPFAGVPQQTFKYPPLDLFEAACFCAMRLPTEQERAKPNPAVAAWMEQLAEQFDDLELATGREIDAADKLPMADWLRMVHRICRQTGQPMPDAFDVYFRHGDWCEVEEIPHKPGWW